MPPKDRLSLSPGKSDPLVDTDANLARAFQELAKGERTASAMETQLTALERKIDLLLATIVSPEAPDPRENEASTETVGNAQSEEK